MKKNLNDIYQDIINGNIQRAEKKFIQTVDLEKLKDTTYIERIFTNNISLVPAMRCLLKNMKVQNTPPSPIDTANDPGRRFFYALFILNRCGGMTLVKNYLSEVLVHRQQELRFLASIYLYNIEFKKAASLYEKASQLIDSDFNEKDHHHILSNLGACYLYLKQYDQYEEAKRKAYKVSNSCESVHRTYSKYDLLKSVQQNNYHKALEKYNHCKEKGYLDGDVNNQEHLFLKTALLSISSDLESFRSSLKAYCQQNKNEIINLNKDPEKFFALCAYISSLSSFQKAEFEDILDYKKTTYPIQHQKVYGETLNDNHFKSIGNPNAENYINFNTQEYRINSGWKIGLKSEVKAIYYLVRAQEYGMSFEALAAVIYDENDYAGLLLIKERITQIIYRIRNHYKIDITIKNYRVFIGEQSINSFYLETKPKLKINSPHTTVEFSEFYNSSESKSKKYLKFLCDKNILSKEKVGKKNIFTHANITG